MKITQVSIGRFHHFHLARQLEKRGLLNAIYTGYPYFQLKDEQGIARERIKTFPWIQAPFMKRGLIGLDRWEWLDRQWSWLACESLDRYVAKHVEENNILIALSSSGLRSGKAAQKSGGKHICDRGSSHIKFQNDILKEEYQRWGLPFRNIDPRVVEKEEAEYEQADRITVPSEFVRNSFLSRGVPAEKIAKIVYGARLERFSNKGTPDKNKFIVLYVGNVGIRKGFMYLLEAFRQLKHPNKELKVVGGVSPEIKGLMQKFLADDVKFLGTVPNDRLSEIYSTATVFVLPSLEEGLAMVQGEALACGCPIISSTNAGAEDLITHGEEGFIVPIRSSTAILERFHELLDDPVKREKMSVAALECVKKIGGWDTYGANFVSLINSM